MKHRVYIGSLELFNLVCTAVKRGGLTSIACFNPQESYFRKRSDGLKSGIYLYFVNGKYDGWNHATSTTGKDDIQLDADKQLFEIFDLVTKKKSITLCEDVIVYSEYVSVGSFKITKQEVDAIVQAFDKLKK